MKYLFLICFLFLSSLSLSQSSKKPQVIVLTDGEVDDQSSMIRFLLYANDFDVKAIIETNSVFQRNGHSKEPWLEKLMDAYEKDYVNLSKHDARFPLAEELRKKCFVGDEDSTHLVVSRNASKRIAGEKPQIDPSTWKDTPGSDKIVEVLLEPNTNPVYIQVWGGGNTAAKAFDKIKKSFPEKYLKAMKKVVMYNIWYQDGAGNYIETNHPDAQMLISYHFSGTWDYGSQNHSKEFVNSIIKSGKSYLGMLYPQAYISEGDSPSFFYNIPNGLRSDENPSFGGYGGVFYKLDGFKNVYRDANKGSYSRWIEYINSDYQARLKWCETPDVKLANHAPSITLKTEENLIVKSNTRVVLEAVPTDEDPLDIEDLWEKYGPIYTQHGLKKEVFAEMAAKKFTKTKSHWWQFEEAGSYKGFLSLRQTEENKMEFIAPKVSSPQTIHLIFECSDTGKPKLTSFKRVVVTVEP